ncbi:Inorganic phosphate transporter PHO84 [Paramyrothecium foliicola]|nr:Inorganic phosphate transporter PHO84 [Paramyrothecium foliicola]
MADQTRSERVQQVGGRWWGSSNVKPDTDHIRDRKQREAEVLGILDDIGFNWKVFTAVSAGFLASSYTIFSSNIIVPALQYVYPLETTHFPEPGLTIDLVTIGTTTLGMIVFGHLADRLGRKRLYGIELFIIILGTIGIIQSSNGYTRSARDHSLNVYAAIAAWRGIQGLGIGAEYPLSAVIAAEFSSTKTRGTLMAAFFAMQSVGRVLAYLVVYGAIQRLPDDATDHKVEIDGIWRLVIGISAIPALLAIGLRLTIPETPRYYTGIEKDLKKASQAVQRVGGRSSDLESVTSKLRPTGTTHADDESAPWLSSAWEYLLGRRQAWRELLGVSFLWFLLDVAFYGLGLDSPSTLHRLWLSRSPEGAAKCAHTSVSPTPSLLVTTMTYMRPAQTVTLSNNELITYTSSLETRTFTTTPTMTALTALITPAAVPPWNEDPGNMCATIKDSLQNTAVRTLLLSSIASIMGSIAAVIVINRFSRRSLMAVTSGVLCLLFLVTGVLVLKTTETPSNEASMVFFALTQFMFNLGPNTLTFILAAESFPTVFRGTFHGVAAASGKLGALLIRPIMERVGKEKHPLMGVLFGFCAVMLVMVVVSLLPGAMLDVQHPRGSVEPGHRGSLEKEEIGWKAWLPRELRNKTLEEIAPNPENWRDELERCNNEGGDGQPAVQMMFVTPKPDQDSRRAASTEIPGYPPSMRMSG